MDYVTSMQFEDSADFTMLKELIVDAAFESGVDISDNVFDWSLRLVQPRISSQ